MEKYESSSVVLLAALVLSATFITHSLASQFSVLSPLLWLGNGIALHYAFREFLFNTHQPSPSSTTEMKTPTPTTKSKPTPKKKTNTVNTTLDTSQGQTKLQPFRFELSNPFDFVNERVSSRLPYLAGTDLKTLKSLKSEPIKNGRFFLRKYVFCLDDVPSVIRSALGTSYIHVLLVREQDT